MKINRKLPLLLGALSAIALGTVGFSSWVVTGKHGAEIGNITATVGSLSDESVKVGGIGVGYLKGGKLSFDADGTVTGNPITAGQGSEENLTFTLTFDISSDTAFLSGTTITKTLNGINVKFETTGNTNVSAITKNVVRAPFTYNKEDGDDILFDRGCDTYTANYSEPSPYNTEKYKVVVSNKDTATNKTAHIVLTGNFAWGSALNYKNPTHLTIADDKVAIDKFISKDASGQYNGTYADLQTLQSTTKFKFTITPILKS